MPVAQAQGAGDGIAPSKTTSAPNADPVGSRSEPTSRQSAEQGEHTAKHRLDKWRDGSPPSFGEGTAGLVFNGYPRRRDSL